MLVAELHGKVCAEVESNEDYLTSAVFGHLRFVASGSFWTDLLQRAGSPFSGKRSIWEFLQEAGVDSLVDEAPKIQFWKQCSEYGEPDLLFLFTARNGKKFVVLIEVKLYSGKSGGLGEDQLVKYLRLLDDKNMLEAWDDGLPRCVIFLTVSPAHTELRESITLSLSPAASDRLYGLQWQELHDVALEHSSENIFLGEVTEFLQVRGFEHFSGFHRRSILLKSKTSFYSQSYFIDRRIEGETSGNFYTP